MHAFVSRCHALRSDASLGIHDTCVRLSEAYKAACHTVHPTYHVRAAQFGGSVRTALAAIKARFAQSANGTKGPCAAVSHEFILAATHMNASSALLTCTCNRCSGIFI